ncbi:MAG: hypothetical protein ACRDZ5_12125, partial [Acidimicrobiales bacterium]
RDVPAERALWRQGAELIEVLRRDHGIDSPRHALGTAKDLRHAPGSTRLAIETARVRLQVIAHELSSARLSRQQARPGLEMASLQRTLPAREHVGGRHLAPGMER